MPGSRERCHHIPKAEPAATATVKTATSAGHFDHAGLGATGDAVDAFCDPNAKARSAADWNRRSGAFSRQRRTTRSRTAGTESGNVGGSSFEIASIVSADDLPPKGRLRPAIS